MAKPKPNFTKDAGEILKNSDFTGRKTRIRLTITQELLAKYLRKFWQDGYEQGWEEGHLEGIDVGAEHW